MYDHPWTRLLIGLLLVASCGPDAPPTGPELAKGGVAAPLTVAPAALGFVIPPATPATITAKVQFVGVITAATSNAGCATVAPASVPATKPPGSSVYVATFTVTPVAAGSCTITVTDKKGEQARVQVRVTRPKIAFESSDPAHLQHRQGPSTDLVTRREQDRVRIQPRRSPHR
jgi:hypothetical protein